MIKIENKEGKLIIDIDLNMEDSREITNILLENKDEFEVKLLMSHLAAIVDSFRENR
ncbi:hypothetical protein ACHRVK_22395 [Flavobacterium plurextorum]|jgi:hypothetical protein|uniref:hypothetical protein n=1 Tax=Flavobacterium TaxID=237 RepID=UPI003757912D